MRTILSLLLISVILWGCTKQNDVTPIVTDTSKMPITAKPDSTAKLTKDDSIHMVAFTIFAQKVKTSVSGKTLILAFDENVNLFLLADGYQKTSAIHLIEDIKATSLSAFDFSTVNQDGLTVYNYMEDNLNNIKTKAISDTTINNVKVVKVNLHRLVTYSKVYGSNQLATDQQNLILEKTTDLITFSSYTYYNQKNYPVTSAVAYIKYVK